jgi:hypothetical protein
MLSSTVARLKREDLWKHFVEFFEERQGDLVTELQSGSVKDLSRLESINSELGIWERLKNLDAWVDKSK